MEAIEQLQATVDQLAKRLASLEEVQGAHRAFISQHQSALKTMAQIMEIDRGLDTPL